MSQFHATWGYVAAGISGAIGVSGVLLRNREEPPRPFVYAVAVAIFALILQVVVGLILLNRGLEAGDQHVFYGVLIAVTFTFAYIYRAQFRKRPAYYYGLLLLFASGLAVRGVQTFGVDF